MKSCHPATFDVHGDCSSAGATVLVYFVTF